MGKPVKLLFISPAWGKHLKSVTLSGFYPVAMGAPFKLVSSKEAEQQRTPSNVKALTLTPDSVN